MTDPLIPSILAGDSAAVRAALAAGADPNEADDWGVTALHHALLSGAGTVAGEPVWAALLAAGADVKAKTREPASALGFDRYLRPGGASFYASAVAHPRLPAGTALDKGATPLHAAALAGDLAAVRALLDLEVRPSKDGVGATPLHLAALRGHTPVVIELLARTKPAVDGASTGRKSLWLYDAGMTPLHAGLEGGVVEIVEALLAAGADPRARTKAGCSAVLFAARGGSVACLDALGIPADELVDEDGEYLRWPLVEAVERGHAAMVERLLRGGARPENARGEQSPLRAATARDDQGIRALLLAHGAAPLRHRHALDAARANDVVALRELAAAGADLSKAHAGMTPLMGAAADGHLAATKALLALGADPDVTAAHSAIHVAIANGHWPVVDALLEAGVDCGVVDAYGNGPVWALLFSRGATTERLARMLALGADPHLQNRAGRSALDGARQLGRAEWVALLEQAEPGEGSPERLAYRPRTRSEVLANADPSASWKRLHAALWAELVPPSGPAPTVQGELIRCIGKLTDEAYRNGNANWGPAWVALVDTLEALLFDGTLGPEAEAELRPLIAALRDHRSLDLRGDGSPHYRVSEAVVRWCLARPELIPIERPQ